MYRGELSLSHLAVLVRRLPIHSELVTEMNDGKPQMSPTEELLADIWVALVAVNAEKDSLPQGFDHPRRAAIAAKAKAAHMKALKAQFRKRKAAASRTA